MLPPVFGVLFDGLAYGMLLFVLSVGLSVTLGLMNFVNLAHCAFAMLGGYVTVTLVNQSGWPFLATLPVAFVAAAAASVVLERMLYRRLYRASDLDQVLLTIGIAFISVAVAAYFFGTLQQPIQTPALPARLDRFPRAGARQIPAVPDRRRAGGDAAADRRARLHPLRRAGARGGRQPAHGARPRHRRRPHLRGHLRARLGLAGLGGALAIDIVGLDPNFSFTFLVYVLIVVSVGGLGSIAGSFAAACLIGVSDIAGKYYVPELGAFLIYLVMVVVLMWRPAGLFGKR